MLKIKRIWAACIPLSRSIKRAARIDPFARPVQQQPKGEGIYRWILFSIPVSTFALGCWQIRRREWKLNLIKGIEERKNTDPVELPYDLSDIDSLNYAPVKVRGHFIHEKEIVIGPRSCIDNGGPTSGSLFSDPKKNQGYIIVTPFALHDRNEVILVNRGWVPRQWKHVSNRQEGQIKGEIELVGIVRDCEKRPTFVPKNSPSQGQWFYRDVEEMAQFANTAPIWLDACGAVDVPKGWPMPNQTRINFRNEHLSYVITWFGLSGVTGFMWFRTFIQKLPLI